MSLEEALRANTEALVALTRVLDTVPAWKAASAEAKPAVDLAAAPVVAAGGPPNNMLAETLAAARAQATPVVDLAAAESRMFAAQAAQAAQAAPVAEEVTFAQIEALAMALARNPSTRSVVVGMVSALGVASVRAIKDKPEIWASAQAILTAAKGGV